MSRFSPSQVHATIDQAFVNLGFRDKTEFSRDEIDKLHAELKTIVIAEGDIDGFIGSTPGDDKLESVKDLTEVENNRATARNFFRYILRGAAVCVNPVIPFLKVRYFKKTLHYHFLTTRSETFSRVAPRIANCVE